MRSARKLECCFEGRMNAAFKVSIDDCPPQLPSRGLRRSVSSLLFERFHSVWPHSDKPRSLEPRPLSRCPSSRIPLSRCPYSRYPFGRCPLSRIPFSRCFFACSFTSTTLISVLYLDIIIHSDHLAWTYSRHSSVANFQSCDTVRWTAIVSSYPVSTPVRHARSFFLSSVTDEAFECKPKV